MKAKLFEDELFVEAMALGYRYDIRYLTEMKEDNLNRRTDIDEFRRILEGYRTKLTPYLKTQQGKDKLKFIKILRALE